ncbi:MAG: transposase [Gemmataceae bacterium]
MAIAYFSTWTTYGTWLPGDRRGWFERGRGAQPAAPLRAFVAALLMTDKAVLLDSEQRRLVEQTITQHCSIRNWCLHAVSCRSNHVHVVVTAPNREIEIPREQFKAWCTRRLKEHTPRGSRQNYWTERGWDVYIDDDESLTEVIDYVQEGQEGAG